MLLRVRDLSKSFAGLAALSDVNLDVDDGEVLGLIGPNGAGKSTLFNCVAGDLQPTRGTVEYMGRDITALPPEERARLGIGRTYQIPLTFGEMTVLENVMVGAFLRHPRTEDARRAARDILELTGLAAQADMPARSLGTAGRKRLEIARALALKPRLLLLDEAMAGLTPAETMMAVDLITRIHRELGIALIIVEHVMEVIVSLAQRVLVLDYGKVIAEGAPQEVVRLPQVIAAYLGQRAVSAS